MNNTTLSQRITSILICLALILSYAPMTASAATPNPMSVTNTVADPGTADTFEHMMGAATDGNRYAGRVWADKSVYKNGDVAKLNSKGQADSSFAVSLQDDEAFQIIFSVLGSSMSSTTTTSTTGPMDVVLILDTSTSMDDLNNGVTRLQRVIEAANQLIDDLLELKNARICVVTYNRDSEVVLPLAAYNNGLDLVVTNYMNNGRPGAGVVTAYDASGAKLGSDNGYTMGTNLQSGIDKGFNVLANATNVSGRIPVAIVLTDGQANRASEEGFYELSSHSDTDGTGVSDARLYLSTLLNAAYNKTKVEAHYGATQKVYSVSVDLDSDSTGHALMNPGDAENGFNASNSSRTIRSAYASFQTWAGGSSVTVSDWRFNHSYPTQNGLITRQKIAANINYVSPNSYYDVSSSQLQDTFQQIYEELSSGVFNPITSSSTVDGATGVEYTPLIYVDHIGQHMEIKEITHVTLFGASYSVIQNADGTYTVEGANGLNPTTNESWNTADDILISVTEEADGTQKLEIKINQEILPILMEQVLTNTVGNTTTSTITEFGYEPMRVYYTVGMDSDILLPGGKIDVSKIQGYRHIDDATGTASFYSNRFGVMNPAAGGEVKMGDAHVGFQPSAQNRYYYYQSNQSIFTKITDKATGSTVTIPENNSFGIRWDENAYALSRMTYAEYLAMTPSDKVYTYVTYNHPTPSPADAANAAEEVTYLVYSDWSYMKESVAFYDNAAGKYINYDAANGYALSATGIAPEADQVAGMIAAYTRDNPSAQIYAVLGVGAKRISRLHNMESVKASNATGTAAYRYDPVFLHGDTQHQLHNDNDVVIWLGNNGKLTVSIDTGIALTKQVTEPIGNPDDTYALTVTVPVGVSASPVVMDETGKDVTAAISTYTNRVLTVNLTAGQTVYISGIPAGTECEIGETIPAAADFYIQSKTDTVTVPTVSQALGGAAQFAPASVTNAPNEYGSLYITKEITSGHSIPANLLNTAFDITVNVGAALAGTNLDVLYPDSSLGQVTVDASGNVQLQLKARQTAQVLGLPAETQVTVTENNPGAHFAVTYRTRNHSGEATDTDNAVTIPADGSATAIVYNHYTPGATSVDLDIVGSKNFLIEGAHNSESFTFKTQAWDGAAWVDIPGKTATVDYAANEHGVKTFLMENVLAGISYTEAGVYAYQVLEVKGDTSNVTYDRTLYTFDVTVTDNGGQLVAAVTDLDGAAITDGSYEVSFTNIYHAAPVSVDLVKNVTNLSGDNAVSKSGFRFRVVRADDSWNPLTGADAYSATLTSDAAGAARFAQIYTAAGVYRYVISELNDSRPGWSYSTAQYRVTVTVAEDNGNLVSTVEIQPAAGTAAAGETASAAGNRGSVTFLNTYDPQDATVDLDGAVAKELTGKPLQPNMFTFYVCENGKVPAVLAGTENPLLVGANGLHGNANFVDFANTLSFSAAGRYEFDIAEAIPSGAVYNAATGKYLLNGMRYDPTIYDLVVEVENNAATGQLEASYYFEDATGPVVTYHNSYETAPTGYTFHGIKLLHGRALRAGEFSFELYEGSSLLETVTNKADGSFSFAPISYTQAGTYTYTIKEVRGNVPGVAYTGANQPVNVTVEVTDINGVLTAQASIPNEAIRFENTYTALPAEVTFRGTKTLKGGTLRDHDFTFNLYATDYTFDIAGSNANFLTSARNLGGSYAMSSLLNAAGTYFFVVTEDATDPMENMVYDRTHHKFLVTVTDDGNGQLKAAVRNYTTGVSSASAASVTAEGNFVNATFDEVTEKEVYLEGSVSTQIDGQQVSAGDTLTYFITYTNFTGEDVVADIMDIIPRHTTYVDGSATLGGTFAGDHINWVLHVARGESVTVSFSVKVNDTQAIVANTAVVRDGVNTYTTNEVVNHTVEEELVKDVFASAIEDISIDGKKVYAGDELMYEIRYTNASSDVKDITVTDLIPKNTTYVEGSTSLGGVFADGKLTWNIQDVPAWATVTVTFKVTVNQSIGAVTIENQATATDGVNDYKTETVTNYTVEDEVEKKVFKPGDLQLNIDGNKVYGGNELLYTIRYKNTSKEAATVTITDTIPQHTVYVEGSADNAGIYADGKLTWTLEVAAGAEVTVSFKVKVIQAENATVKNTATVLEGSNYYTTNEVTTPIGDPDDRIPQTGDNVSIRMLFALMLVSGGGILGTALLNKKRNKTETI